MNVQPISTKQLRTNFSDVIAAMNAGQSLMLFYRSKPLAKISPVVKPPYKLRAFSKRQIEQWVKDDALTPLEQRKIDAILNRVS